MIKKSTKTISSTEAKTELGSTEQSSSIDTSKSKATSRVRYYFEANPVTSPKLSTFPNLGTSKLKTAMNALKKSVNKLPGINQDSSKSFSNGYHLAMVEVENMMEQQNYKRNEELKRDTATTQNKTDDKTITKTPSVWLILGVAAFLCILIYFIVKRK